MYNLAIRKCTSPPLLAPRSKIFKLKFTTPPGSNPGPAEPEADMLPSEPARRAIWKLMFTIIIINIIISIIIIIIIIIYYYYYLLEQCKKLRQNK